MQVRRFTSADGTLSRAGYSDCGRYRFSLTRRWSDGPRLGVIMLNPSTATERTNDPTIARVEARARAAGFGAIAIGNLFALRATRPDDLFRDPDPIGPRNDRLLAALARSAALVLCAWGADRRAAARAAAVSGSLRAAGLSLVSLGTCRCGAPRHPLYVARDTGFQAWPAG